MTEPLTDEDRVVVRVLEHGGRRPVAEEMWPGGCTHFEQHTVTPLGFQPVRGRDGGDDRVGVLTSHRPEAIVTAEAMLDGVAHQLVQKLRLRAQIHGLLFVLAALFDGQADVALSESRGRQLEHLANAGAGLGQRADQELIAVTGSCRGNVAGPAAR